MIGRIFNKRQLVQFCKNEKIEDYYQILEWDKLPIFRGHLLTDEDLIIRKHILNLMCEFETSWTDASTYFKEIPAVLIQLKEMEKTDYYRWTTTVCRSRKVASPTFVTYAWHLTCI
jgi:coproporphyrinogen III oxidase-like Fe-S oxidoreductase